MIYFIQNGSGGAIKIGRTKNIKQRMESLQAYNPVKLILLGTFNTRARIKAECECRRRKQLSQHALGDIQAERRLHYKFADHRLNGEWFKPHADILNYIASRKKKLKQL